MTKLYSRRQDERNGKVLDIFVYDKIPEEFRNQCFYILHDFMVECQVNRNIWQLIRDAFLREKGWKMLARYQSDSESEAEEFIEKSSVIDFIDYIDFAFRALSNLGSNLSSFTYPFVKEASANAIDRLNYRLKYHQLGYRFENNEIIRIDNEIIHSKIVKPSFVLIHDKKFAGAEDEMMKAYDFRRKGDNKNAILEAEKAYESVLKTICKIKGYEYDAQKDTPSKLIKILVDNQFFPAYLESHMSGIRITLESGLPTMRNKNSGHGQGEIITNVPDDYSDYALNLLATNIVFLVNILNSMK